MYNEKCPACGVDCQAHLRQQIIEGLEQCTDGQVRKFKQMYAFEHLDDWTIKQVVAAMSADKLGWALQQVTSTLKKYGTKDNPIGEE